MQHTTMQATPRRPYLYRGNTPLSCQARRRATSAKTKLEGFDPNMLPFTYSAMLANSHMGACADRLSDESGRVPFTGALAVAFVR